MGFVVQQNCPSITSPEWTTVYIYIYIYVTLDWKKSALNSSISKKKKKKNVIHVLYQTFEHSLKDWGFKLCLQHHCWVFVEDKLTGTVFMCKHCGNLTDVLSFGIYSGSRLAYTVFTLPPTNCYWILNDSVKTAAKTGTPTQSITPSWQAHKRLYVC